MKKFLKKVFRLRKKTVIVFIRLRKIIRRFSHELFKTHRQNKFIILSSFAIVITVVTLFGVMSRERFPYGVETLINSRDYQARLKQYAEASGNIEIEMGSGLLAFNRADDITYTVKEGESLPEIAYLYNLEVIELMLYNGFDNLEAAQPGRSIIIPSAGNIMVFMEKVDRGLLANVIDAQKKTKTAKNLLPKTVGISCNKRSDGQSITATFAIETEIKEKGVYFEWELGDGKKSFRKTFNYTYNSPGTYIVSLNVKDIYGNQLRSRPIYLDIPYATNLSNAGQVFITVNNVGEVFSLDGEVHSVYDALGRIKDPIHFINKSEGKYYYQAHASGYYSLHAQTKSGPKKIYLFVSPFDSVHNDRNDVDWYRTQFNTGLSNCGPAIASMGIGWSKGQYVSVSSIRDMIGWTGDGGTSFFDLKRVLDTFKVPNNFAQVNSKEELCGYIDKGNIVGVVFNCGQISYSKDQPQFDLVGKYYQDSTGHYSIVKGYTKDKKYFILYDPIPSDWINNGLRYGDGMSMIGRNRYYPADELFRAMSTGTILVILR